MLEWLREFSLEWYRLMSQFGYGLSEPVAGLARQVDVPAISAFLFGLIGSLAPCQLSANAGAVAYLSNRAGADERSIWRDTSAYVLGKVLVYTVLGAFAILLGFKLPTWAMVFLRKLFGPMMIVMALYLFRVIRLRFSAGERLGDWLRRLLPGRGNAGAFAIGAAYSFSFCPTMALLFFGLLVPLGVRQPGPAGLVLPGLFGVGTAVPLLLFAGFLTLGLEVARDWVRQVRGWDLYIRIVAGLVFLVVGVNDTILYWFI